MRVNIDKDELYQLFVVEDLRVSECAVVLGVDRRTVKRHLIKHGLFKEKTVRRDEFGRFVQKGQTLPPMTAENHQNFKNGAYCYRVIAENHHPKICFHCGSTHKLQVHHMDRNRHNNHFSNLRWVCPSCHMKIEHADRLHKRDKLGRFI